MSGLMPRPVSDEREAVRAAISNAYYDARNAGRTMESAADDATDRVLAIIAARERAAAHVVHVTVEPVAEDVVWCETCEEWVTSGAPQPEQDRFTDDELRKLLGTTLAAIRGVPPDDPQIRARVEEAVAARAAHQPEQERGVCICDRMGRGASDHTDACRAQWPAPSPQPEQEVVSGLPTHAPGGHEWLTACGQDRANVRQWTDDRLSVTCRACLEAMSSQEDQP